MSRRSIEELLSDNVENLTSIEKQVCQGYLIEVYIGSYLSSKGKKVVLSKSEFDSVKDMTVDEKTVEVKGLSPIKKDHAFMPPQKHLSKIRNSHRTYLVALPVAKLTDAYNGEIYELDSSRMITKESKLNGQECIPINQPAMELIGLIPKEELNKILKYSTSAYTFKN